MPRGNVVVTEFETEYERFLQSHVKARTGTRKERLQSGHGFAEKEFLENVWWPLFHHFNQLHPEYETRDFKDGYRYIDFAYITPHYRIAIEIDGLGPHWRNITKWKFADHCQRQNQLVLDEWFVLRFPTYDVEGNPRMCQQTIQQLLGSMPSRARVAMADMNFVDRQIVLLTMRTAGPVTPLQAAEYLRVSTHCATRYMRRLCAAEWLQPASGTVRVRSYELHPSRRHLRL